jgi:dephospho-CoA kinase
MMAASATSLCACDGSRLQQRSRRAKVVGITGGIATGKSAAATFLCERLSAYFLSADAVCRELLMPENRGWHALRGLLYPSFFMPDGTLDRPLFRERLFADSALREQVNAALHPLVRSEIHMRIGLHEERIAGEGKSAKNGSSSRSRDEKKLCLVEVPLLYEVGWQSDFDRTVLVYADCAESMRRLRRRDNVSFAQAELSLRAQMPIREKIMLADHVIDNSGPWSVTCIELLRLAELLRVNFNLMGNSQG